VLKLSTHYADFAAVVAMARRANAPVRGMPELDAAQLARFWRIRHALLLGEQVPDVTAELSAFFRATHGIMTEALTPEVEAYARARVAASSERQQWLLRERQDWGVDENTLLWQQTEHELRDIRTELCQYRAFETFGRANRRGHNRARAERGEC
jgi:hypothetical protein